MVGVRAFAALRRWHMWLGWLVGVPMLFWTLSGWSWSRRPIEEVRGTACCAIRRRSSSPAPPVAPRSTAAAVER